MPDKPTYTETQTRIRELLGRATLLRARGDRQEALKLAEEAISLDERGWESQELRGDVLLDLNRGEQAMQAYRRARELNPERTVIEEKIGRAAISRLAVQRTADLSQQLLDGARPAVPPRKPGFAALLSLLVPGLGQLYNGQVLKGFVTVIFFILVFALTGMAARAELATSPFSSRGALYGPRLDASALLGDLFSGASLIWILLLLAIYIYSIADAGLTASRSMTADETGIV
jgi:tetratricopeptide (TPR) repeat protein